MSNPDLPLPELPPTPLGRYRHYKGGEYDVIGVARHSETLEQIGRASCRERVLASV